MFGCLEWIGSEGGGGTRVCMGIQEWEWESSEEGVGE